LDLEVTIKIIRIIIVPQHLEERGKKKKIKNPKDNNNNKIAGSASSLS
jgi:hypothetical protein